MQIKPFAVEMWMNAHETRCAFNLAETCVASLSIGELLRLTGQPESWLAGLSGLKMNYGHIEGSPELRGAIARLYQKQQVDNIVTTHGTIGANALVYQAMVSRGDRVISLVPSYQQHTSIPQALGAEVSQLKLREENGFLPDLDELSTLASKGAKLIALTNPNNPTGALIDGAMLAAIVDIARKADAWILSDEVYRGTDQHGSGTTASVADLYERGISTAGMSKAFALAGLRLGWIAAPREVIEAVLIHRDYNTISAGVIDEHFAALALSHADRILERSRSITRGNLAILSEWMTTQPRLSWVKPKSGTTALLRYDLATPSHELALSMLNTKGVLFTPGSAMDMESTLRIGYANYSNILEDGLEQVSQYLKSA